MNKFLLCVVVSISVVSSSIAIPAYPHPVKINLPDGTTLTVRNFGDEYFHFLTTEDSYVIARGEDGFYYYASYTADGRAELSEVRAHNVAARDGEEQAMLAFRAKGRYSAAHYQIRSGNPVIGLGLREQIPFPNNGSPKSLVILVSFSDVRFSIPASEFSSMLNEPGYSSHGATGGVRDYYSDNSNGRFTPEFVVVGPVSLTRPMSYYGQNEGNRTDTHAEDMVVDACRAADQAGVDFSQFDKNGDGIIDNIFVYYAGYNEAELGPPESIWPHRSAVSETVLFDGLTLQGYACSSELKGNAGNEMAGIGALCHEFAHVLGLPDLYDTDHETDGKSRGVYNFSLMGTGNYNNDSRTPPYLNVMERAIIGWMEPEELTEEGNYSLESINRNKAYYYTTELEGEYFMLENRQPVKWDIPLPGQGLLIYHIDCSDQMVGDLPAKSRWKLRNNNVNSIAAHPCMMLMDASGQQFTGTEGNGSMFFPGSLHKTEFTAMTNPSSLSWSGMNLERDITDIREIGERMSFYYSGGANVPVGGVNIQPVELILNLWDSVQLVAVITPANALNKKCDWYSSDRNRVTVNEKGIVKGVGLGVTDITVMTRDGGFQATCRVTVTQDFVSDEEVRVGQREVWLTWKENKEILKWIVRWKEASAGQYLSAEADSAVFCLSGLKPATKYIVQLATENESGMSGVVLEKEVTTAAITSSFAAIGGIKGSYVAGETMTLNLMNAQSEVVKEKWTIDGKEIFIGRKLKLPPGEHEIKVKFKEKAGTEETIARKVVVQP